MQATADSLAFAPPPEPAAVRGFVLAVIAHLLLLIALSGLITWQSDDQSSPVQAELWSSIPREAAPAPPPPTSPQPKVQVQPQPKEVQPAPPPVAKQPDIAVEREKKKREEEAKRRAEDEQRRKQLEAQKRKLEEQKVADEKARKEEVAKQQKEKQRLEQIRKDQIARMQALAAGSGSPMSQGTAQQSTGPSASYASRLAGIFKRNMHFPVDGIAGNPKVQVKVRVAPGGIILGVQVTTPSGNPAWDDAVVRAIENTPRIPPDEHGKWITEFPLIWGPKDV